MQVFNAFFKVARKNMIGNIMFVVIYLGITIAVSNTVPAQMEKTFLKTSLNIGLENQDDGSLGEALSRYLAENNNIKTVPKEKRALQDAMYYQEIDYVLTIPKDFTEKFAAGEREGLLEGTEIPGSASASLVQNEIEGFLRTVSMYLETGFEMERALDLAAEDMEKEASVMFLDGSGDQALGGGFYFFNYLPYVFTCMMILGIGFVLRTFGNKDLSARNKCSAMPFLKQNAQIILGCLVFMTAVYAVFMVMACVFVENDYMFSVKGALSAMNAFVFSICALSVAWFVAQFAKSVASLNIFSNLFGLSFCFLGGVFISTDVMSEGTKQVAKFVPSYWYVLANREIQKVAGFSSASQVYQSCFIVLMFAAAFFAVGLFIKRMKLRT